MLRVEVAVAVQDHRNARVSSSNGDLLVVGACCDPQGDRSVSQVVDPARSADRLGHRPRVPGQQRPEVQHVGAHAVQLQGRVGRRARERMQSKLYRPRPAYLLILGLDTRSIVRRPPMPRPIV